MQGNDNLDPDTGANNLQNYPVITNASGTIQGTLNSAASQQFLIQFFLNQTPDGNGFGKGKIFLGEANVTTNVSGNASFNFSPSITLPGNFFVTATDANGNTSEFSQDFPTAEPTAAMVTVGGRVVAANGQGMSKAVVTMVSPDGSTRTVLTNPFGYYRFLDVPAGADYIFTVSHKLHQFAPASQMFTINDEEENINFVGLPLPPPGNPEASGFEVIKKPDR